MLRAGPRRVQQYSLEFKLKAVQLSQLKGVEVQSVAEAQALPPERAVVHRYSSEDDPQRHACPERISDQRASHQVHDRRDEHRRDDRVARNLVGPR